MNFKNDKKTFLAKLDQSKKGNIDEKVKPLLDEINNSDNYYSTSSCSGRVYLWKGTGKKSETKWLKVSHDLITEEFFAVTEPGLIWLRFEPLILHVACKDLNSANNLLQQARIIHKKSNILSISSKIIVEIRSSDLLEMPLYDNCNLLFNGDLVWLKEFINQKLEQNWQKMNKFKEKIKN